MTASTLARFLAEVIEQKERLELENAELRAKLVSCGSVKAETPEWLNVKEAAEFIRRPKSFLDKDRIESNPKISYRQDSAGGRVLYARCELEKFVKQKIKRKAA